MRGVNRASAPGAAVSRVSIEIASWPTCLSPSLLGTRAWSGERRTAAVKSVSAAAAVRSPVVRRERCGHCAQTRQT